MSDSGQTRDDLASLDEETRTSGTAITEISGELRDKERLRARGEEPTLEPGTRIGRYVVTGRLGEGGMGMVYSAWDPDLDRKVAIKLLRAQDESERARSRLLREAQALAKLSHPNVVNVHDVGVTEHRVFIAMEHLDGSTLKEWLRARRRSWPDIVAAFVEVARGLAAAHDAGIVHRDVKPSNILVEHNGRVRILDFGVARLVETESGVTTTSSDFIPATPTDLSSSDVSQPSAVTGAATDPLTHAGALIGTPAYMAPEQKRGQATPATDQYSFCVCLFEALLGHRPQGAADARQERRIPRWLSRAIARGLRVRPAKRYASMTLLADELERGLRRRRRLPWLAAAAAAAIAGSAGAAVIASDNAPQPCEGAGASITAMWNDDAWRAMRARFGTTGRPHAERAFERAANAIDERARRWQQARVDACRDTRVRGVQSDQMMDLRMQCLERVRAQLTALVTLFRTDADGSVVDRSLEAVSALRDVDACADVTRLAQATPLPEDANLRSTIADIRTTLDRAAARDNAGLFQAAMAAVEPLVARAQATGFAPVIAEATSALGDLQITTGDLEAAEKSFFDAIDAAARAKDDLVAAQLWIRLIALIGNEASRYDEALTLIPAARYAIERAEAGPADRASLLDNLGLIHAARGDYSKAQSLHEQALKLREEHLGPRDLDVAVALTNLGNALIAQGELDRARQTLERAVAIDEDNVGSWHPEVAASYVNLARVLATQGEHERAESLYNRALGIWTESLGGDHPRVAATLINLGDLYLNRGDYGRAFTRFGRGREILVNALGPVHPHVGFAIVNQAEARRLQNRCSDARALYEEATALWLESLGDEHPYVGFALTGLGLCQLELGAADEAVASLRRALTIHESEGGDPLQRARTQFAIARALPRAQRSRAASLARAAREEFASLGDGASAERKAVEAWLRRQ